MDQEWTETGLGLGSASLHADRRSSKVFLVLGATLPHLARVLASVQVCGNLCMGAREERRPRRKRARHSNGKPGWSGELHSAISLGAPRCLDFSSPPPHFIVGSARYKKNGLHQVIFPSTTTINLWATSLLTLIHPLTPPSTHTHKLHYDCQHPPHPLHPQRRSQDSLHRPRYMVRGYLKRLCSSHTR